jgi:predicted Ser/Thr protein kinase
MTTTPNERVAELFEALVELESGEAERQLQAQSGGDAKLAAAVRVLLAHDRAATGGFLAPVVDRMLAEQTHGLTAPPEHSIPISARLSRYHVLHKLGEGGMGSVYVGYDEALDRRAALKVLHGGGATDDWLRREGQALGRLAHPNVVSIYEVGEHEGLVFLAMELVEGPSLREWLAESPRTFTEILRLFLQAGLGLAAAHRAGLVHRDFKLENVLVGPDGRARVADFGIATLVARLASDEPPPGSAEAGRSAPEWSGANHLERPLTQAALVGTPAYMAPEQFEGARATPLSDQWSFAVALYRAIYGQSPFPGADLGALSERVRQGSPALPARRADVPAWLWPILSRCLSRTPTGRFGSMDELLREINKLVPRDPERDPTIIVPERKLLTTLFILGHLAQAAVLFYPGSTRAIGLEPAGLIAVPAASGAALLVAITVRWRQLSRNIYGRQLSFAFAIVAIALLAHRLLCLRLGLSGEQIMIEGGVLSAVSYGAISRDEHRWLGWIALIDLVAIAAATVRLDWTAPIFGIAMLATIAAMSIRAFVDRYLDPAAVLGPLEHAELSSNAPAPKETLRERLGPTA